MRPAEHLLQMSIIRVQRLRQIDELFRICVSEPQCIGPRHVDQKDRIVRVAGKCPFVVPDRFFVIATIPGGLRLVDADVWLVLPRRLT